MSALHIYIRDDREHREAAILERLGVEAKDQRRAQKAVVLIALEHYFDQLGKEREPKDAA
jgi:hypothetical protein